MTDFAFTELVDGALTYSTAFGTPAAKFTDTDRNKLVKLGTVGNTYVLCADGDDIEGYVHSLETWTVNDGYSFGSVRKNGRKYAQAASALTVGAYVVAAAPTALGTPLPGGSTSPVGQHVPMGLPLVKAGPGVNHKWRVIAIVSGSGAIGDKVLIERV
jgi:hypothetical protein